jgi:hypothetical protein
MPADHTTHVRHGGSRGNSGKAITSRPLSLHTNGYNSFVALRMLQATLFFSQIIASNTTAVASDTMVARVQESCPPSSILYTAHVFFWLPQIFEALCAIARAIDSKHSTIG